MTRITTLSLPTMREVQEVLRDRRPTRQQHTTDTGRGTESPGARLERWVQTTTCDNDIIPGGSSYPTFPASKFVIQLGDLEFDDTNLTNETPSFVPYDPGDYRVALSTTGYYIPNTITRATLHHGRWYLENDHYELLLAKSDSSIAPGGSGVVSIWDGDPLADTGSNVIAHHTWMEGDQTIEATTELVIRWFERQRKYVIIEAECPS